MNDQNMPFVFVLNVSSRCSWSLLTHLAPFFWALNTALHFRLSSNSSVFELLTPEHWGQGVFSHRHIFIPLPLRDSWGWKHAFGTAYTLNRYFVNDGHSFRSFLPAICQLTMQSLAIIVKLTYLGWIFQLAELYGSAAWDRDSDEIPFMHVYLCLVFPTYYLQGGCPTPGVANIWNRKRGQEAMSSGDTHTYIHESIS